MLALVPEVFFIFIFSKYARMSGGGVLHPARFLRVNFHFRLCSQGLEPLQYVIPDLRNSSYHF